MVTGWKLVRFKDVCSIKAAMIDPREPQYQLLPHIGNENIEKHTGNLLKFNRVKDDNLISGKYYFTDNEILYGKINPHFAKVAYPRFCGLCSADIYPICCVQDVTPAFLKYILLTEDFTSYTISVSMRSGMPKINRKELADYQFSVPPLVEQERIAEALSDVDSMISSLEKLIAKKKAVKQGAMQELLTGKKRLPGFTREWECHRLGEYVDCVRGVSYNGSNDVFVSESNQTIRLLRSNNIQDAKFDSNDVQYIRRDIVRDNQILKKFDIIICMANGSKQLVGKNCIFTEELNERYTFGAFMSCLRATKSDTNMNYIFELLNSTQYWNNISLLLSGSSINNLRPDDILEMEFEIPSIAEQTAIASLLSDMDNEIEALEQKLAKTRQLKQGMMQQLLTGKIRLMEKETITDITAGHDKLPKTKTGHNHQFDDAIMIAAIVNSFYSEKYPLGRKKVQKLLYLLRRKQEADTSGFKKKAAGPYADEIRYKGGEPIAKKNGYISATTTPKGTSFSKGKKIDAALSYVEKWKMQSDIDWLVSNFKYVGVNDLELYATIDMAICDLRNEGVKISVDSVKTLIRSNSEWKAKLKKAYFSDADIARAINMSYQLYS